MNFLSIRDLQETSCETSALDGPTLVKAGERTIGVAKKRHPEEDQKLIAEFGDVDPVDWIAAVRKLKAEML